MKNGFTLVEMMVAMALMLIALSAFVTAFVQSKRSSVVANHRLEALALARDAMESMLSSNYFLIQNQTSVVAGDVVYVVARTVRTNTVQSGIGVVKDVSVKVTWCYPSRNVTACVEVAGSISSELHP